MKTLTEPRLLPLLRELDQRERELRRRVAEERKSIEADGFAELMEQTGDEADHAFARIQVALESSVIDHYLGELQDLAAARDRFENGTFGICIDCGEHIDYQRLQANPAAGRCMECQHGREQRARLWH